MTCKHGHEITHRHQVYIDRKGHKRCRTCHLAKVAARHYIRKRKTPQARAPVQPWKYRTWAETVWAQLSERDKRLVANGLKALAE